MLLLGWYLIPYQPNITIHLYYNLACQFQLIQTMNSLLNTQSLCTGTAARLKVCAEYNEYLANISMACAKQEIKYPAKDQQKTKKLNEVGVGEK